ncbi:hypothetical protein G6F65_023155 [Rhizopus arrhizus]|nr:hypothetical protein G6F65_023155 [Rhizopus arrhizus]
MFPRTHPARAGILQSKYGRSQITYDPLGGANGASKHDASSKSSRSGFRRPFRRRWSARAPRSGSARRPCRSGRSPGTERIGSRLR